MNQLHQLTTFDDEMQSRIRDRVDDAVSARRVKVAGVTSGGVLFMVGALFAGCRLISSRATDPFAKK